MANVIGIQFQQNGKMYYFDPGTMGFSAGQYVIVDTARGQDLAEVILEKLEVDEAKIPGQLRKVIRAATPQDIQHASENRVREKEAYTVCQRKISEHKLEMKLVSVECAFDDSKILFYFTANGRVDFRSLVKDLASVFKTRIELRQIGVRDEARMLGGLGPCGRPICCGTFLADFQPVSIKMAKEQNLSLNPTKISGVCGRLMCCLKYEQDHYEQTRKRMPKVGGEVTTPDGTGIVTELNIVKETLLVRITNGDTSEIKEYPLESISRDSGKAPKTQENPRQQEAGAAEDPDIQESAERENNQSDLQEEDLSAEAPQDPQKRNPERKEGKSRRGGKAPKEKDGRKLGQPVKRENPKRPRQENGTDAAENRPEGETRPAKTPGIKNPETRIPEPGMNPEKAGEVKASEPKPVEKKAAWAAQLEKAMQSAKQ